MASETVAKKKKKRKGLSFNSCSRKSNNSSKTLQNLPSYLSDFTWIENTEDNKALINEERVRLSEQKRLKDLEKKQKSLEEQKQDKPDDTTMIDTSTMAVSTEKPATPLQDFETWRSLETLDDLWYRAEMGYYHSLSNL